jgi:hypothetical protein
VKNFLSDAKFVLILLAFVTVISGLSNLELEGDQRPTFQKADSRSGQVVIENEKPGTVRTIASVESTSSKVVFQNFFCNHSLITKDSEASVKSQLVMLNFKICKDLKNINSVVLFNQTNGFKAQIFKTDNSNYKTDFIQLDKGTNKIIVEIILKDGQKHQDSLVILTGS